MVKKGSILLLFWLISFSGFSQRLISYVTVSPSNAYIGQPVKLKVSVFTTTWFTQGVDVGNIQVDGALTVYFRSLSNSRVIGGKKYAGVDFYYNLFPTKEGTITIPAMEIQVETPKEGGYKGIKRTLTTKPKTISVKGVPLGYDPNNWLVARSLNVSQKWSVPLNNIKVGDVIQRTIKRFAAGTLSEFLPETKWDSITGVSLYPTRPKLNTHKSKTGVSATRNETVNYLFEKEGEIIIPAIEYVYWNSSNKKFYKKQIDSVIIHVKPNADLAMLASIKKSLQKETTEVQEEEKKEFLILGLTPAEFLKYLVITLFALYILYKLIKKLLIIYKKRRAVQLKSEAYAFKQLCHAVDQKDYNSYMIKGKTWLLKLEVNYSSISDFSKENGTSELNNIITKIDKIYFKEHKTIAKQDFSILQKELKESRKKYLKKQKMRKKAISTNKDWLNPTS